MSNKNKVLFIDDGRGKGSFVASLLYAVSLLRDMFPNQSRFRRKRYNRYGTGRTRQGELCKNFKGQVTRQRIRAALRRECLAIMKKKYSGELRPVRRRLALALARNRYKAKTTGVRVA